MNVPYEPRRKWFPAVKDVLPRLQEVREDAPRRRHEAVDIHLHVFKGGWEIITGDLRDVQDFSGAWSCNSVERADTDAMLLETARLLVNAALDYAAERAHARFLRRVE